MRIEAEKAEESPNDIGLDKAGRIKPYYDAPNFAWDLFTMLSKGIDGADLDFETLANPRVANEYVTNVLHDLIVLGTLRKYPTEEVYTDIEHFAETAERELRNDNLELTSDKKALFPG